MPALTVTLVVTVLLTIPLGSPVGTQHDTALTGIGAALWMSNAVLAVLTLGYFGSTAEDNPLLHTWSLSVEEQFYVFFPLLVVLGLWIARRRKGGATRPLVVLMTLVAVPSFLLCWALTYVELPLPVGSAIAFYSPFTRAWEFAAGAFLALAGARAVARRQRTALVTGGLGLALLVVALVVITDPGLFPGWQAAIPVAGASLLLAAGLSDGPISRALSHRVMTFIGDVSYGWYLFHWPLLVYVRTFWEPDQTPWVAEVAAVVAALGLATISFRWLEEPIRHRRVLGRVRTPRLAAALLAPSIVVSLLVVAGTNAGWGRDDIQDMQAQLDHGQWKYQAVCQSPTRLDRRDVDACRFEGSSPERPIIVMGDSNAGVYADALVAAARELDRTITVATVPSCALVDLVQAEPGKKSWLDCSAYYRASIDWLRDQEPSVVVMASGAGAVESSALELRLPDGRTVRDAEGKSVAWEAALDATYRAIAEQGSTVIPISIVPHFFDSPTRTWSPRSCQLIDLVRSLESCGRTLTRAEADERQAGVIRAEQAAAAANGLQVLDLRGVLCPDQRCSTRLHGTWAYENGTHLSYPQAMALEPILLAALRAHP